VPAIPLRRQVRDAVEAAWGRAVASGSLPALPADAERPTIDVERPANPVHGDLSANLAMKLARPLRMPPQAIATALAAELVAGGLDRAIETVDVAAPGFLNIRVPSRSIETMVDAALEDPTAWGSVEPIRPREVNVEFVSANPTGPLTGTLS
jgi:arginyl-tRNA synthetase